MRVTPIGWAFDSVERVLEEAGLSALPSHNDPDGIKGAQAVAVAVLMARTGRTKSEIKAYIEETFGYDLNRTLEYIRKQDRPWKTCSHTVPQAITAFMLSTDFESAIRYAVSMGGEADTTAAIAGGIAEAFYGGVPESIKSQVSSMLDDRLRAVIAGFHRRFGQALTDGRRSL